MCVVSMITDHYFDRWKEYPSYSTIPQIPQEDIDEFKRLLERAREYDKKNNQPDCELEEKRKKLLKLARELGVDINFL